MEATERPDWAEQQKEAVPPRHLPRAVETLETVAHDLDKALTELEQRLRPLLPDRPETEPGSSEGRLGELIEVPASETVALGTQVDGASARISNHLRRINRLNRELGV